MEPLPDIYQPPTSSLKKAKKTTENGFSTLGIGRQILLILLIALDIFLLIISVLYIVFGAHELGFLAVLIYASLATFTYKSTVQRQLGLLITMTVLHIFPGFNVFGLVLSLILVIITYQERRSRSLP